MQVPLNYKPRWYQAEGLRALESGVKLVIWCWARRGGKDLTAFSYEAKKMVEQPMNIIKVFPTKEQGKNAFWDNVENDGFKTIEHIPEKLIARQDNTEMKLSLINGSTFQILGAKDPEALRGANGRIYDFSEFVDIPGAALDVVRPIVAVNGGQIIIQSTPKIDGISGGTFKILFDLALKNPKQFASLVTAKEYLDDETLEELRLECIAKNGNDFFWRQEYLCDWGQASSTSYYGQILRTLEDDGRIGMHPHNPSYPVYTAWDLGMSDSTAIVFFQYYDKKIYIVDYYETHDIGSEPIVKFVQSKPYNLAWHFFPHDGSVRDSDAIARIEKIRDFGLLNSSLLQREPVEDGIKRVVEKLPLIYIHQPNTIELIRKLYLYKRKFNALTGDYLGPEHTTVSHAADSIRYMFSAIEREFAPETCTMYMMQSAGEETYESEFVTTNFYSPQQI